MTDPQHLGLGELGQRVQAMGEAVPEPPRLRPYQAPSLPNSPAANGRPSPAPAVSGYTPLTGTQAPPAPQAPPVESPWGQPARLEPFSAYGQETASESKTEKPVPPASNLLGSGLLNSADAPNAPQTGLQRAVAAVRSAIPLVQKLLPLLDGNFASIVGALVAPQPGHHPPPQQVKVDLEPVERGLAEVRTSNRELRTQVQEQGANLKRVEDQLERVREATDRNTLEQQELVEDLRSVGSRISTFAIIGLVLLLVSLGLNIYFLIQLQHILR